MKTMPIFLSWILSASLLLLTACGSPTQGVVLKLEMDENYSSTDPFVNAKLFTVTEDIDSLDVTFTYTVEAENCLLEIIDNETKEPLWSTSLAGVSEVTNQNFTVDGFEKDGEYALHFTGTKVKVANITLSIDSPAVQERSRPQKQA